MKVFASWLMAEAMLLAILVCPVFGGDAEEEVPYFTDQDLSRYRTERSWSGEPAPPSPTVEQGLPPRTGAERKAPGRRRYEVPYRGYEGAARRIIIDVTINGTHTVPMALDTGAPGMHISFRLAERLGIFEGDEGRLWIRAKGIGGSVPAVYTIIDTVEVGGARDRFVPTIVSPSVSEQFEGLLGMDFMANYSVHIDTERQVVVFEELPPRADRPGGHDEAWWRMHFRRFASLRSQWKGFLERLKERDNDSGRLGELRAFAERQYREADRLFNKLNVYAAMHAVPMSWRRY